MTEAKHKLSVGEQHVKLCIAGYGNLGKSLEKAINADCETELTAVYSRRNLDNPLYRPLESIKNGGDFDAVLIAQGSFADVEKYAELFADFDTVDSFDTHAAIIRYKKQLTQLNPNRVCIVGAGWDPGTLSLVRAISSVAGDPITVWGPGISQGHSNAARAVDGVIDAVQFTLPKKNCRQLLMQGVTESAQLHDRLVYLSCVTQDCEEVERQIKAQKNYFADYDTEVKFVSPVEVRRLKKDTRHSGRVFCKGQGYTFDAHLEVECNTDLTARIMLNYVKILPQLKKDGYNGALDVLDVPLKYLVNGKNIL